MKANKLFNFFLIGGKGIIAGIVTGLIMFIPAILINLVKTYPVAYWVLGIIYIFVSIGVWGFIANKIWGWK
jgi:hypothetical protein